MMLQRRKRRKAALELVAAFNSHDARALGKAISDDCIFIDSSGDTIAGAEACTAAMAKFMAIEPDFAIAIAEMTVVADEVLISGTTSARNELVAKDRLWRAKIRNGKVSEWQSFCDGQPAHLAAALQSLHPVTEREAI